MTLRNRIGIAAVCFAWAIAGAQAATITTQSASSQVDAYGTTQAREELSATDSSASTSAIWPAGTNVPQGRTAARSSASEIAANARVFSDTFAAQTFDLALSQAYYAVQINPLLITTQVEIDFFLPPSYLEIVTNGETYFHELNSLIFAELRVCQAATCSLADRIFDFQANASGTYQNVSHSLIATGDPSLDLTPLLTPTVTDTSGFVRTYLVEFPSFEGHVDLGTFAASDILTVEYTLQARAWGPAQFSSAIAAVNDPFLLATDPVLQGAPLRLTTTGVPGGSSEVPEPASVLMVAPALGLIGLARRRTRH